MSGFVVGVARSGGSGGGCGGRRRVCTAGSSVARRMWLIRLLVSGKGATGCVVMMG